MKKDILQKVEQGIFYGMICITVFWFLIFINHGIDVTDQAYYLVKYKYHLSSLGTFFTDLIGDVIYHLFNKGQVLVLSICSWMLYMGSGLIVYVTLRKQVSRILLLFSIWGGSLFSLTWVHVMNYNATSMFMQTLAICILIKGIEQDVAKYYFVAGITFGLNTFFRLPNILQIAIGLIILWNFGICRKEWKLAFQNTVKYAVGVFIGWAIGGSMAWFFMGKEQIYAYLFQTANTASDVQNKHGLAQILNALYHGAKQGLKDWLYYGILILLILVFWNIVMKEKQTALKKDKLVFVMLLILAGGFGFTIGRNLEYIKFFQMIGVGLLLIMLGGVLFYRKRNAFVSSVCAACFFAEVVLCIGTDNGWYYQLVFLIFPLCVSILAVKSCQEFRIKSSLILGFTFLYMMLFTVGIRYATQYVYRDAPNRELQYSIQAKEYWGIRTSKERAELLNGLERTLEPFGDEQLLIYGSFNIGYVISDMPPFIEQAWLDLEGYSVESLKKDLASNIEKKGYPVILLVNNSSNVSSGHAKKKEIIEELLQKENYVLNDGNEWYKLYIPENNY